MNPSDHDNTFPALYPGDLVCIREEAAHPNNRGVVYEIVKENRVNWRLEPLNGDGASVSCPPQLLRKASDREIDIARAAAPERRPPLHVGAVVTVSGPGWREPDGLLWSVIKTHFSGAADLARLGSDDGRFYPRVPRGMLTALSPEQLAAMVAAVVAVCHVDLITTSCHECGRPIPDTAATEINDHHATSCSLHPSAVGEPGQRKGSRA